jgi:hypothetical protein
MSGFRTWRTRHDRCLREPDTALRTHVGVNWRECAAFGALEQRFVADQRNAAAWTLDLVPLKIHAALRTEALRDWELHHRKFLAKVILSESLRPGFLSLPCDDVAQVRRAHGTIEESCSDLVATKRAIYIGVIGQFGNTSGERSLRIVQSDGPFLAVQTQITEEISPRELYILWPLQLTTDSVAVPAQLTVFSSGRQASAIGHA